MKIVGVPPFVVSVNFNNAVFSFYSCLCCVYGFHKIKNPNGLAQ